MSPSALFAFTAVAIIALALYAVIAARELLRKLIALNVLGAGVFLIFVSMAHRPGGEPDPVPHAMVLTGIVVTVAAMGLAVAMVRRNAEDEGDPRLPEDRQAPAPTNGDDGG